jgi:hypothetical protein
MSDRTRIEYLYKEDRGYIAVSYNKYLKAWELHMEVPEWGNTIPQRLDEIRECRTVFEKVKQTLRNRGIDSVIGLANTGKEAKFNMFFGFVYTGYTVHTTRGKEKAILYLEL